MNARHAIAILGVLGCAAGGDLNAAESVNEADAAAKVATEVCSFCHGPEGRSTLSATPNLAGQPWPYLAGKIKVFRNRANAKSEEHIDVLGLTLLDDPTAIAIAHYFANQSPAAPVAGDATLIAAGEKIYMRGDLEHKLPPCAACHGTKASGFWIFPRLAGQHAEYVERQLWQIQSRLRDSPLMHGIIKDMTADEMKAVAAFVQSK